MESAEKDGLSFSQTLKMIVEMAMSRAKERGVAADVEETETQSP
jgi:hypothetical protein